MGVKVRVEALRSAANACFDYISAAYGAEVELPDEFRWTLPFEAAADMRKPPSDVDFLVEEIRESNDQVARVETDDGFVGGPVEMEHLGLLLREISEVISPS